MKKVLIIDGNSLMYRGFYAIPLLTNSNGEFTNAIFAFSSILIKAIDLIKPTEIVVAFDFGKKTFRNEIFSEYKGTRKSMPTELAQQFPSIKEMLEAMQIKYVEKAGIEADDIIATLSKRFQDREKIILTGDKDSFQLIDKTTKICFTRRGVTDVEMFDEKLLMDKQGITPSQVVDLKALMGDKSDNIPGVKGVGEVTAHKLISEYGTLDNVYANLDKVPAKYQKLLIEKKDDAYMSYKLAKNVEDDSLDCNLEDCKLVFPFSQAVKDMFTKYEFKSLLNKSSIFEQGKEKEIVVGEIVDSNEKLSNLISLLNNTSEFSLYLNENNAEIAFNDRAYIVKIDESLLFEGVSEENFINEIKPLLENEKILKVVLGFKQMMHKLRPFNISFANVFDLVVAKYLLNASSLDYTAEAMRRDYDEGNTPIAMLKAKKDIESELEKYNLTNLLYNVEIPLTKVLFEMECNGVKVDMQKLQSLDGKISQEIAELEKQVFEYAGYEFNLQSPAQVGKLLYDDLNINPRAKTKSTSIEKLKAMENKHPVVSLIIRHRKLCKIKNTYIEGYTKCESNGYIYTEFLQTSTDTGRLSSRNPNLQNIPVKDDEGKFIREMFVSRFSGGKMVSFDYNQIELKLMAHVSQDKVMVDAFNTGGDIHTTTASKIYKVDESEVNSKQRRSAKTVNFGIIYGQTAYGLSEQLECSVKEASDFIQSYFETFKGVKKYTEDAILKAKENNNTALTLLGRRRFIPELGADNFLTRSFGERVAINMPLQGSASDIIKMAMIKVNEIMRGKKSKLILQIHDELVFDCEPSEIDFVKENVKKIMENIVALSVPLTVSVSVGDNLLK